MADLAWWSCASAVGHAVTHVVDVEFVTLIWSLAVSRFLGFRLAHVQRKRNIDESCKFTRVQISLHHNF